MSCSEFSDIDLITFVAGDGDGDPRRAEQISEHLRGCAECRRAVEHQAAKKSEFLSRHSFEQYEQSVQSRGKPKVLPFPGRYALAAALVLFLMGGYVIRRTTLEYPPGADYRIKGKVGITVWGMGSDGSPEVRENGIYYPRERIQLTYSSSDTVHLTVLGIEETGSVQTYFPSNAGASVSIEPGSDVPLPNSIILDGYVGSELYAAVFSKEQIPSDEVEKRIRRVFERNQSFGAVVEALSEYGAIDTVQIHKEKIPSR